VHSHYFGKVTCNEGALEIKDVMEKIKSNRPNHIIWSIGKKWAYCFGRGE
jgi:hypothetical protein